MEKRRLQHQKEGTEQLVRVQLEYEGESCMDEAGRDGSRREEVGSLSFLNHSWVTLCQVLC